MIRELHIEFEDAVANKLQQLIEKKPGSTLWICTFQTCRLYSQDLRGIESFGDRSTQRRTIENRLKIRRFKLRN
jgi:hypothetical protein